MYIWTPWAIKIRGLLHERACTHTHALHTQSPDRFAAHTSVSDPDLERVSLDTTGDQDSSTYCTRELASFMYGEVHATAEPNNPADTQLATQPHHGTCHHTATQPHSHTATQPHSTAT